MGWGKKSDSGRREPNFGPSRSLGDVRPNRRDRVGEPDFDEDEPVTRKTSGSGNGERKPAKGKAGPKKSRARRKGGIRAAIGRFFYWSAVAALWGGIIIAGVVIWVGAHLPPIHSLEIPKQPPTIQIAGMDGSIMLTRGEMTGTNVALKDLPPYLPNAFIAIEDRRFYSHWGIDPVGIARAAYTNLMNRGVAQGGSTLTQQLAKNLFLTQERTFQRKLQEAELAIWLERKHSKQQILELYLNRVYFGSGAYGVEAAAQRYFGKSAKNVTVAEAAMLAGLVKSPSRLAPNRNPEGAERRARTVLAAMVEANFITPAQAKASAGPASVQVKAVGAGTINYVADWINDVLDDLVGSIEQSIIVDTTIDPKLQKFAEATVIDELAANSVKFNVSQGALVAMTPEGAVRAMVGGLNYSESQFNRAVTAKRQPGSAFKPFVFLTAIEQGMTPETIKTDAPVDIKGWKPENYTHEYFGSVTLNQALSMSLNTVAVRLGMEVGPRNVVRTAHRLGISSKLEANASLALGTSEVSLTELVGAYAAFANGGYAIAPHVVTRIRTADGKRVLYKRPAAKPVQTIDARSLAMMNAMMQTVITSGTGRKADLPGWSVAGKTGTSQDFRDAWFLGYTSRLVTGVWLGNDNNQPTKKASGGTLPVEIWSRVMKQAHQGWKPSPVPGSQLEPSMVSAGLPSPFQTSPGMTTAPRTPAGGQAVRPEAESGIDGWLMDRLFGRH